MYAEYYLFGVYFIAEVDSETNEKDFSQLACRNKLNR